jgi:hypothetical protein
MASQKFLPNELLVRIFSHVHVKADLANLRLVSHAFESIATEFYFATVPLYAHWETEKDEGQDNKEAGKDGADGGVGTKTHTTEAPKSCMQTPNNINYDSRIFKNILDNDRLKTLVKKVDIYTCNPDCVGL